MFPNGLTCCFKPPDANLGKLSSWNDFGKNKKNIFKNEWWVRSPVQTSDHILAEYMQQYITQIIPTHTSYKLQYNTSPESYFIKCKKDGHV